MAWYLKSTAHPNLKFKIVELDKATKRAMLKGETGVPFSQIISDENLKKYGYEVVKVADDEAASM